MSEHKHNRESNKERYVGEIRANILKRNRLVQPKMKQPSPPARFPSPSIDGASVTYPTQTHDLEVGGHR